MSDDFGQVLPPVSVGGNVTRVWEAEVVTVNAGTVTCQNMNSRTQRHEVPTPYFYTPTIGDRILLTDQDGDKRKPAVVAVRIAAILGRNTPTLVGTPTLAGHAATKSYVDAVSAVLGGVILLQPTLVNALPGSPYDGQEIYFQNTAMAALGVRWHLVYRSGASGSFKWESAGGNSPLYEQVDTDAARGPAGGPYPTTYGALTNPSSVGPSVTVPLAGDYKVGIGAQMYPWAQDQAMRMSYTIAGSSATIGVDECGGRMMFGQTNIHYRERIKTFAASDALVCQYKGDSTIAEKNFSGRYLGITPIRVG